MEIISNHIFGGLVWSDDLIQVVASPKTQTVCDLVQYLNNVVPSGTSTAASVSTATGAVDPLQVIKAVLMPDMTMVFGKFEYRSMRELVSYETAGAVSNWVVAANASSPSLNIVVIDFIGIGDVVQHILHINTRRTASK